MKRIILTLALLLIAGCATSPQFQAAAVIAGPRIASMAQQYVAGDKSLSAAMQAQRLSQVAALQSASSTVKSVTEPSWESAFYGVDSWLPQYVATDTLIDAQERADRMLPLTYAGQMIASEKSRPFGSHAASTQPSN